MKLRILAFIAIVAMSVIGPVQAGEFKGETGYYCTAYSVCKKGDVLLTDTLNALRWCDISQPITTTTGPEFGPKAEKIICVHRGEARIWRQEADLKANLPTKRQQRKEADLRAKLQAEENHHRLNSLREAYIEAVRQKVERNWRKPPGSGKMPICEVHVVQGPGGIILDVTFGACGGSTGTYRASIENAVYKAEPLPKPGDPALFEREMTFLFNPEQQ